MPKKLVILFIFFISSINLPAQFGLYASAVYMNVNGSNTFYNNTAPGLGQDIGSVTFQGTDLGPFEQNSGTLHLVGSEAKTYKGGSDNVCSATLFYTIYPTGSRPVSPVFTGIDLGFYSDCFAPACGSFFGAFNISAGGGCCSAGDQKWQNPGNGTAANIDLTTNTPAIYTLEAYYAFTGQDGGSGCGTTKYDNNNNNPTNYTASFTITTPVPVKFGNIDITNNRSYNSIYWNTYSESQTSIFKLERSENGTYFYPIAQRAAAGFSSSIRSYTLNDINPVNGFNYYRIKMIESDGSYQYSDIVKTNNKFSGGWSILHNPSKEKIELIGLETGDEIIITDATGLRVYCGRASGNYQIIHSAYFANGIYFIKVINTKAAGTKQVIITH